jgi:hypothetical protein
MRGRRGTNLRPAPVDRRGFMDRCEWTAIDDVAVYDKQQGDHAIVACHRPQEEERYGGNTETAGLLVCEGHLWVTDMEARS